MEHFILEGDGATTPIRLYRFEIGCLRIFEQLADHVPILIRLAINTHCHPHLYRKNVLKHLLIIRQTLRDSFRFKLVETA